MPRTPPAFVRSIGSRLHSRSISKIPDPKAGSKHWEIGTSGPGYLWPPRQLDPGQQLARMMMANPNAFAERSLAHEAAAGVYFDEGVRRALEDNQRQIAKAEERQREREEREKAEAKAAKKLIARAGMPSMVGRREHRSPPTRMPAMDRAGCQGHRGAPTSDLPPPVVLGVKVREQALIERERLQQREHAA